MTNCSPLQPPCKVAALLPEAPHGSRPSRHDADRNPRGTDRVVRGGQQAEVAVSHWHRAREVPAPWRCFVLGATTATRHPVMWCWYCSNRSTSCPTAARTASDGSAFSKLICNGICMNSLSSKRGNESGKAPIEGSGLRVGNAARNNLAPVL